MVVPPVAARDGSYNGASRDQASESLPVEDHVALNASLQAALLQEALVRQRLVQQLAFQLFPYRKIPIPSSGASASSPSKSSSQQQPHTLLSSRSPSLPLPVVPPLPLPLQHQQIPSQHLLSPAALVVPSVVVPPAHNLTHLQSSALTGVSLCGTPGHEPALIIAPTLVPPPPPVLTVQDFPSMVPPVYNGVNPNYPGLRLLNSTPPIFCVDNFLTAPECDFLIHSAHDCFGPAPVVGQGAGEVSPSRTSSTCYLAREDLPNLMRKVSLLTGKPPEHCELPQVGRYFPSQQYLQHYDAFDLDTEDGRRFASNGGQRTCTVLIYLNEVPRGGQTRFPALELDVQPRRGMALVFFPATVDGMLDKMALHAAMPAIDTKYVSQVWIRQSAYNGQPSKRLQQPMIGGGMQVHHAQQQQHQVAHQQHQVTQVTNQQVVQQQQVQQPQQFAQQHQHYSLMRY